MHSDVLIIGAGAIGSAIALALAERGLKITIVESGRIGRGATWASAGFLGPDWSAHDPPALKTLSEASLDLWADYAAMLEDRTGVGLQFRRDGLLNLWVDPEAPNLPPDLATAPPPPGFGEPLSVGEARRLEPILTGPIAGGALHPEDAQVDNTRLASALVQAAVGLGARVQTGMAVVGLTRSGPRCTGVRLADGSTLSAGAVVLAAGAWSGPLASQMDIHLPMEPWRGQMLLFDAPMRPVRHVIICGELVLIPRPHGPLVLGTTFENAGFNARVTLGGLSQILARASRVVPELASLPYSRAWAGLRPGTPDHLPYLGPIPGWEGLFAATGHGRKGILLTPLTGQLMARLIVDEDLDPRLEPCLPGRGITPPDPL